MEKNYINHTCTAVRKPVGAMSRCFLIILVVLGHTLSGRAQQYHFHNYTGDNGLSQLSAQALFQDRDGYIWIGTQSGLNRYDGNEFEIFSISQGLENDWINAIAQDSSGKIWIGTNSGLSSWEPQGFENYSTAEGLVDKHVLSLAIDRKGNVWCGTRQGLTRWNGSEFYNFTASDGLPAARVDAVYFDHNGRLWVGTEVGLYYRAGHSFVAFQKNNLHNQRIYKITEDAEQRLWIGLQDGVRAFSGTELVAAYTSENGLTGLPVKALWAGQDSVLWVGTMSGVAMIREGAVQFITTTNGLPFHNVSTILEDREGIVWLGGFGGVAKFVGRAFTNYTKMDGLGSDNVRPILRDHLGNLWVGTLGGLSRFDGKTWRNFDVKDGLNNNNILSLLLDSRGILWVGNLGGLNYFDARSQLTNKTMRANRGKRFYDVPEISQHGRVNYIAEDSSSALWYVVQDVGLFKRTQNGYKRMEVPGQSFSNARLLVDHRGNVWASGDHGLSRWNGKDWKTFTTNDGLADNEPYFLYEDRLGRIWFGYHSSRGLTYYDGQSFKTYTTADGLSNDAVYSIGVDHQNHLWIGTARGVDYFDGQNFINYGTADGYASQESNSGGFFADGDGTLWFGTAEGLSHYNPRYDLSTGHSPSVKIQRFTLGNKLVAIDTLVTVNYARNDLRASIAPLSYINEKRLSFRYRLRGYDDRWQILKGYEINYTNLGPGTYSLEVQGRKYQQNWSKATTVKFRIKPPYWLTWWFGLLLTFVMGTLVISIFKFRVYKIQSRNRWLEQTVAERTAELKQQNARLETTLAARRRAEDALRLTQFAIDHSSDTAFWMGPDARFLYVNETACRVLDYSREELLNMTVHDIDPEFPQEVWPAHWAELKRRGSFIVESLHRTKDGRIFPVEISANYLEFDGKEYNCAFGRDITQRKLGEKKQTQLLKKLEKANQRLEQQTIELQNEIIERKQAEKIQSVFFQISEATNVSKNLDELLKIIHQQLAALIDTSNFYVALYDEKEDMYSFPYYVDQYDKLENFSPQKLKKSLTDYVRRTGKPLLVDEEVSKQLIQDGEVELVGSSSDIWLGVPLRTPQAVIGVVAVQSYSDRTLYTKKDLQLLTLFSGHIAMVIERKRAEEKLRLSDLIIKNIENLVLVADKKGEIVFANPAIIKNLGYSTEEVLGDGWLKLTRRDQTEIELEKKYLVEAAEGKIKVRKTSYERKVYDADGNAHWILWNDASGPNEMIIGIGSDITVRKQVEEKQKQLLQELESANQSLKKRAKELQREVKERKQAEKALRESEQRYSQLVEQIPDGIYRSTPGGKFVTVNSALVKMLGYDKHEDLLQMYIPRDLYFNSEERKEVLDKFLLDQKDSNVFRLKKKDGNELWVEDNGHHVCDAKGRAIYYEGVLRDISERRRAEKIQAALFHISEATSVSNNLEDLIQIIHQQLSTLIDTTNLYIALYDEKNDIYSFPYCVDEFEKSDSFTPQQLKKSLTDYVRRTGKPLLADEETHRQLMKEGKVELIGTPSAIWLGVPLKTAQGVIGVVVVQSYNDRTLYSEKDLELLTFVSDHIAMAIERIRAADELKSFAIQLERSNHELQSFAYVASHDLQEPLRKVQAFGDRLKDKCRDVLSKQGLDYLERMQNAAERMQTLINDLLTYSRVTSKAQPFVSVNLARVTQEVLSDLEVRIDEVGARVKVVDLPTIEADSVQMRQLLQNLIGNALKFHRKEEPPVIIIHGELLNGHDQDNGTEATSNGFCQLTVEDNGIGFDEKYSDRIFGVFQRLHGRSQYEGTGVGLAVCRKIVERHGGSIKAKSKPRQGAKFIVTLPLKQHKGEYLS